MTTTKTREVLALESINGVCVRGVWLWLSPDGEPVTRHVNILLRRGLMHAAYYSGGRATASITQLGRSGLGPPLDC